MLKQEGIGLLVIIVFLYLSLSFFQNVLEHLFELGQVFHQWFVYQKDESQMRAEAQSLIAQKIGIKENFAYHNAQTFDYSWHYLGEYKCIVICKPKCVGTRHWILELKSKTRCMYWRIAIADSKLNCETENELKLTHHVMHYPMMDNFTVMKE